MHVIYSDLHRLHDPEHEFESSRFQEPFEHPGRAEIIRATLAARPGFVFDAPDDWGTVISHMLWTRRTERLRLNLFAARCATVAVTVLGGVLLWAAARRFGERTALVTQALWCVSPSVLANGALATLDKRQAARGYDRSAELLRGWTNLKMRRFSEARQIFKAEDKKGSTKDTRFGIGATFNSQFNAW